MSDWTDRIHISLVDVTLSPMAAWRLPPNPEVALRGALGRAMMERLCTRAHQQCHGCDRIAEGCLIPAWFDPGRAGHSALRPVVVSSLSKAGVSVSPAAPLQMRLMILGELPKPGGPELLLSALMQMATAGLGRRRIPHLLTSLSVHGSNGCVEVISGGRFADRWPSPGRLSAFLNLPDGLIHAAEMRVTRPLQWKGAAPDQSPKVSDVLKAAIHRVRWVSRCQGVSLDRWWPNPAQVEGVWQQPQWVQQSRYSKRQNHEIDLSGWTGTVALGEAAEQLVDLLAAAELLGIGRNISAGGGRIEMTWNP